MQWETLNTLRNGAIMTVDADNYPWLGDSRLLPSVRYFLTDNDLVTRLDKTRPVAAKGNGLILSEKGLSLLMDQPPKRMGSSETDSNKSTKSSNLPTERQLAFASSLGLEIPSDVTAEEVSDLISARLDNDTPATERLRSIAALYGAKFTRFTGTEQLAARILNAAKRPTHENDLAAWFIYNVYCDLAGRTDNSLISGPHHPTIKELAGQFAADKTALGSARRYDAQELRRFGQWIEADGSQRHGGSKRTAAYEKAIKLLKDKFALGD